jgi:16S rRNA (uracil1498-N3)-methyltransferase
VTRPHAPHFFVDGWSPSGQVAIKGADAHHLARVRRAKPGDFVQLSDGAGRLAEARLSRVSKGDVLAEVVGEETVPPNSPRVALFQGLAKGTKVDVAVQKLVELGVDDIVIFNASRSVPDWDEPRRREALNRWRSIALEAAKQSRRSWLPLVLGPLDVAAAAAVLKNSMASFVADPAAPVRMRNALHGIEVESVSAVAGPEGGLTDDEIAAFAAAGATPVALGNQILRSETASLALATILMFHFGLLG